MKFFLLLFIFKLLSLTISAQHASTALDSKRYISLPDYCPIPDNMAKAPDGSLTLTCPNYTNTHPGIIVSIDKNKNVKKLTTLPGLIEGTYGRPKGLDYADDGSLIVCNAMGQGKGSILRITFQNGIVDSIQTIATGLRPNGLKYHNGFVYVTQPRFIDQDEKLSGIYKFSIHHRNIHVTNKTSDPHLIFTSTTENKQRIMGLDGLCFDKKGRLYAGEFADGTIYQLTLDPKGNVKKSQIYAQLPPLTGLDGMIMDDNWQLYVCGFSKNQLLKVDQKKNISLVVEYADNNGAKGELDQPVDLIFFDDKLLISNFDLMKADDMVNTSHSRPYTISYIDTKDL